MGAISRLLGQIYPIRFRPLLHLSKRVGQRSDRPFLSDLVGDRDIGLLHCFGAWYYRRSDCSREQEQALGLLSDVVVDAWDLPPDLRLRPDTRIALRSGSEAGTCQWLVRAELCAVPSDDHAGGDARAVLFRLHRPSNSRRDARYLKSGFYSNGSREGS